MCTIIEILDLKLAVEVNDDCCSVCYRKLYSTLQCNSSVIGEYGGVTCLGSCNMLPWFISRPNLNVQFHALGNVIE